MSEGMISLTKKDLQELLTVAVTSAIQEAKKPIPPTVRELSELQMAQQHREETAQSIKTKEANQRWMQEKGCNHEHSRQAGGGTHCVFVRDNDVPQSPGYVFCQDCRGRFRPDEPLMRKLDPKAIFDTSVFNRLLQDCSGTTGAEILG